MVHNAEHFCYIYRFADMIVHSCRGEVKFVLHRESKLLSLVKRAFYKELDNATTQMEVLAYVLCATMGKSELGL